MKANCLLLLLIGLVFLGLVGCRNEQVGETPVVMPTVELTATPVPTVTPDYEAVFETAECRFDHPREEEIRCGYLVVPEVRSNPERMIRLHVAVVPSIGDSPAPDPVVYLSGGPGLYTLEMAAIYTPLFREVLKERDVILFDQRGVGYSEPSLDCPEVEQARLVQIVEELEPDEELAVGVEAATACRERLVDEGVNLSAYTSAASAADLDDLRQVLGYESWNLFGVSYGTRLALTTMRAYGDSGTIRSVVLDSVFPPQVNIYADWGVNADRVFSLIFERCAALENCNSDYPDLKARFYGLVDALNGEPMTIFVNDRINRTVLEAPFDGDDLIGISFVMAYGSENIINFPKMIRELENGNSAILNEFLAYYLYQPAIYSEGMQLSVNCFEELPFNTVAEVQETAENLPPQIGRIAERDVIDFLALCEAWGVETAEAIENEPVVSDIPTLILAGDYDPITPPYYGMETAEWLSRSFYFEFEGLSHSVAFSSRCGMDMAAAFLDLPDVPPDASCMERLFIGFVPY